MKIMIMFLAILILLWSSTNIFAETLEDRVKALEETLNKQEQTIKELRALEETLRKQEQTIEEQRKLIEELKAEAKGVQPPPERPAANEPAATEQVQQQIDELKEKVDQVAEAQTKNVPSVFNPSIGFVGETIFSYNSKPSAQVGTVQPGGFNAFQRSMELNVAASVDPFARGYAVINGSADARTGEVNLDVEEAAIVTTSLPWNLTLQAGLFFGEFGRLSYIHDHELPFVNRPLVLDEYVGGESKTYGLQLNYLFPIEHYVSLTTGVGTQFGNIPNNFGESRQFSNLNFWGRLSTSFDLTPDVSLEPGISALWNPKTDGYGNPFPLPDGSTLTERERRLLDIDLALTYRPLLNNQFQSLTWGTEVLYSDNRYDINYSDNSTFSSTVPAWGLYSYLAYKFHRQWTTGFEFQWLEDMFNNKARTFAYSPYITWAISHWNQLRLEYTYTDPNSETGLRPSNAVYLQWAWIIGSHSHGWQQR